MSSDPVVTPAQRPAVLRTGTRIGIDLVRVDRIAESMRAFGDRFTRRIFAAAELSDSMLDGRLDAGRLALRFSAKEAAIKAFDLSEAGIGWSQIELTGWDGAGGRIRLHGRAAEAAARLGAYDIAVASSQQGGLACAIVVAFPCARERGPSAVVCDNKKAEVTLHD